MSYFQLFNSNQVSLKVYRGGYIPLTFICHWLKLVTWSETIKGVASILKGPCDKQQKRTYIGDDLEFEEKARKEILAQVRYLCFRK